MSKPNYITRDKWNVWLGPEVEGRLLGLPTIFFGGWPSNEATWDLLDQYTHVFFGTPFLKKHGYSIPLVLIESHYITLEVTLEMLPHVPASLMSAAHLLICIEASQLGKGSGIKPSDTIRIDLAPYTTLTAPVESFHASHIHDYDDDQVVDWNLS